MSEYDLPFGEMEQRVIDWVQEALELRHGDAGDPEGKLRVIGPGDGPDAVRHELERVRRRSDRVDELLANVTQARGRAKRARDQAAFSAEVAYDTNATQAASKRREFSSGRERHSEAQLQSLEERRIAHRMGRIVSVTEESYEVIKQVHFQLGAIRNDLRATIHSLQFESSLER